MNSSPIKRSTWRALLLLPSSLLVAGIVEAEPLASVAPVAEAQRLIAHATIDFSQGDHHYYEYFAVDGASRGGDGTRSADSNGHWFMRPDATVCFMHADPNQSGCVFVRAAGDSIEFHRVDGVVEGPFKLERGNPHRL